MQEQVLTKLRDIKTKLAQFDADISHGDINLFSIKPKLEKIINLYVYCFENGDVELLNPNSLNSIDNDLNGLLEAINNLPSEHHRLEQIKNLSENSFVQFLPQLISITFDNKNFSDLLDNAKTYTADAKQELETVKTFNSNSKRKINETIKQSQDLLDRASTGILAEQIDRELKSRWNIGLLLVYVLIASSAFVWLLCFANQVKNALVSNNSFNYHELIVAWLAKLPVAVILVIVLVLIRSRIKYIDILRYRKSVALSLQAETQLILDKAKDLKGTNADKVRMAAIELFIEIMKEFASTPSIGSKQEAGIGVPKLGGVSIKDEN